MSPALSLLLSPPLSPPLTSSLSSSLFLSRPRTSSSPLFTSSSPPFTSSSPPFTSSSPPHCLPPSSSSLSRRFVMKSSRRTSRSRHRAPPSRSSSSSWSQPSLTRTLLGEGRGEGRGERRADTCLHAIAPLASLVAEATRSSHCSPFTASARRVSTFSRAPLRHSSTCPRHLMTGTT